MNHGIERCRIVANVIICKKCKEHYIWSVAQCALPQGQQFLSGPIDADTKVQNLYATVTFGAVGKLALNHGAKGLTQGKCIVSVKESPRNAPRRIPDGLAAPVSGPRKSPVLIVTDAWPSERCPLRLALAANRAQVIGADPWWRNAQESDADLGGGEAEAGLQKR